MRANRLRKWGLKLFHRLRYNSKKDRRVTLRIITTSAMLLSGVARCEHDLLIGGFERDEALSDAQRNKYRRLECWPTYSLMTMF